MYQVSDEFLEKITDFSRDIKIKATFNNQTTLYGDNSADGSIISINFIEQMEDSKGLCMGTTCMNTLKIKIIMPTSTTITLNNGYIKPYVGLVLSDDVVEWVPLGKFNIKEISTTDDYKTVSIVAYDEMVWTEKDYITTITTFPATAKSVLEDIARQCFITIKSGELTKFSSFHQIKKAREDSCRTFISYCAGLIGANARFDRNGELEFVYYDDEDPVLDIDRDIQYISETKFESVGAITVNSLTSGDNTDIYTYGSGTGITFHCPDMTQDLLDIIGDRVVGLSYYPVKCKWRGNPALQCGDRVKIENKSGILVDALVMRHDTVIAGGLVDVIYCYESEEASYNGYTFSPTTRAIQKVYDDLQLAIIQATSAITGAKGGIFSLYDSNDDGINDGFILADNVDLEQAHYIIRGNYEGIGLSTDGGHTFTTAMTGAGINASAITSGSINANMVTVGSERLGDYFKVEMDNNGHPIVIIGASDNQIKLKETNDRIGFYDADDRLLAYFSNSAFEIVNLNSFRLGGLRIQELSSGIYGIVGVYE